ncbi:xylitol dehydrogenase [Phellopilus nigrolimitatus]|nr:xylitol dehydrogenase [Phellopilus nigrolimitatus]
MLDNNSFVLKGILDASFEQRPIPELKPDEVLIEVKKTGVCGSDVHFYAEGRIADNIVTQPFTLGHESSGVISKVGTKVTSVKVGDRVAMEPGATCRVCDVCKAGKYQLCADCIFAADHPKDGTLGRYYKLPADLTYKLPEHLTLEDGAMMEPLSVAVHAVSYIAKACVGQNVVVFGCGPIGLLCMAVAKAFGMARIIAIDIVPARLEFAKTYAATDTFLPPLPVQGESKIVYSKRTVAFLRETLGVEERGPKSIDLVIDATGSETCIQMGFYVAKIGGTYVQVNIGLGVPSCLLGA